ncbi:MAG TPA: histidinol-phosphate transaminase [candidate division Zixibacteria bacterium]|nr:histidinol-phosphate transaminase [candidate division Zixibacteria bacterium]
MKKEINLADLVNDPFEGKEGFMPEKIKEKIKIRIGLNENLAFPEDVLKKLMLEVAKRIDPRIYPEDYCESLCVMLAEEHNINSNQVVVGNGGDKIIDLMVRLTIVKGKKGVIINPTYPMYEHALKVQGGDMKELLLTPAPEFDLDPDYILSNITPKEDRLLFLCSPNNPTGNQFDESKLRKIIAEFPGIVALDETYSNFGTYSLVSALNEFPNLIIMKSFSKFFGMAGMRIGYALGNEFLISRIKELHPAFNVNIASLELAKLVIKQKEVLSNLLKNIVLERERVFQDLKEIDRITPHKSFTNFILFRIEKCGASIIQRRLLEEWGILVRNMSAMPLCENTLRMTITTKENNEEFLHALKEIIDTL